MSFHERQRISVRCALAKKVPVYRLQSCIIRELFFTEFAIQGGDIVNFNGSSGESIYGPHFDDENFTLKHVSTGLLSMVNEGQPNTNSSQFIITVNPSTHLDDTNVVFGKVVKGMSVVLEISKVKTEKDRPIEKISIVDCGEIKKGEGWGLEENDGTEDIYTPYPEDWNYSQHVDKLTHKYMETVIRKIKDSGNSYFLNKNYLEACRKYKKALRYYNWMGKQQMSDTFYSSLADLKLALFLNLAAVYLKQEEYRKAIDNCNEALTVNNMSSKALFRRGQAYACTNEYTLGLRDFNQAYEISGNKTILEKIDTLKKKQTAYVNEEKKACQKMFK
ncbi:peptidyl-prolyl cis-trans isomerase D isoform X2 [Cardiocondyla obscurior]|uniref:peptidyl-prolyl cis-trans isomerase D isoform X2 n=1 Tax=Cardiocondyla obscurior TaxID=286306 RepID=UPI0039656954